MTYTYDLDTDIGKVRFYTDDRDLTRVADEVPFEQRSAVWTDEEVQLMLDDAGSVNLAIARALETLANNRQLLVQSRRIGQTAVDYGDIRAALLKQAANWRAQASGSTVPADGIAEQVYNDFGYRRILDNRAQRGNL